MRWIYALSLFLFSVCLFAQHPLEGTWQGTMIDSSGTFQMQLHLEMRGNKLVGTTFILQNGKEVLSTKVNGTYFFDRSLNLFDQKNQITTADPEAEKPFPKHYQLLYTPSAFGNTLEGFWQEYVDKGFVRLTRLGKITLTKLKNNNKA